MRYNTALARFRDNPVLRKTEVSFVCKVGNSLFVF